MKHWPMVDRRFTLRNAMTLIACVACSAASLFANEPPPASDQLNADPIWLNDMRWDMNRQFELLVAAYSLDAQQQAALRQELEVRLFQQKAFEDKENTELDLLVQKMVEAGEVEGSPEAEAASAKLDDIGKNMPLAEEQVAAWVDRSVPAQGAAEGRQRWEELRQYRESQRDTAEQATMAAAGVKAAMREARVANEAVVAPVSGQPFPGAEKGERVWPTQEKKRQDDYRVIPPNFEQHKDQIEVAAKKANSRPPYWKLRPTDPTEPNGESLQEAPTMAQAEAASPEPVPAQPENVKPRPASPPAEVVPQAPPPPPAPPLDEWDKHVLSQAERYRFTEAQMTNAQSILRELKRRANQYRLSRAEEIAKAQLNTSAKAREEQMRTLNRPVDAMFEELKQRVDALATIAQRQKVAPGPAAPRMPAGRK